MSTVKPTVKPLRNRLRGSLNTERVHANTEQKEETTRRLRGRPILGERRVAPLLLTDLRPLAALLGRAARHLPAALRLECERQLAKVEAAAAHLEANPAGPRKVRDRVTYAVLMPGAADALLVSGMMALGKLVGRSPAYVQKRLSQGGGATKLQRQHPETGNPDYIVVTRVGTNDAVVQASCQKPKTAIQRVLPSDPSKVVRE